MVCPPCTTTSAPRSVNRVFETLTSRYGYKAKLLLCRNDHALLGRVCRALDYLGGVLLAHVFDLNGQQRTEFQTLLERLFG